MPPVNAGRRLFGGTVRSRRTSKILQKIIPPLDRGGGDRILRARMFDLNSLNPQQRDAVVTHRGPVLILAGAGTGKTRTLTCRIAHMVSKGVPPGQILAVTFTNKAAREMSQRVLEMLPKQRRENGEKPERPTLCTFHSLCVRILRTHIEKLGYKKNFFIYDESDQISTMKRILSQFTARGEKTDASAVLSMLSKFKNAGPNSTLFGDEGIRALAEHVRGRYESALHACNAVDFDDLILLTLRLFREHPDALVACRARWQFVMVDEYQDTNSTQFALVQSLTSESRNLCVVGDDDQSIYGWRGAEIANILDLEKHYPEVKIIKLEQNYRSTNCILKAANAVIKNNTRRRGKNLWSAKGDGNRILMHTFDSDEVEAKTVVENIEYDRLAKRIGWGKQAVLFRTNLQSRALEMAFRQARVRYHLIGGQSFFDRREIRDFLSYVKTFVNPHDDVALLRVANVPARGLSDVTMERLLAASAERQCSVFTAMHHTDVLDQFRSNTREAIQAYTTFIDTTRGPLVEVQEKPLSLNAWAEAWLNETGYLEELRRLEKDTEAADARVRNVKELLETMDADGVLSAKPMDRLDDFLEELTLDQERKEEKDEAGDAVTLITVHASKGLEFAHVHLVGVEDGLMPHSRSKVEGTMDEERRLFYVAITRAQETLRISHCEGRKRYGQLMPCHPSPFLQELPEECLEHAEATDSTPVDADKGADFFARMRAVVEEE
jgi:DNA helicase-2/ATP-dependent DNA helicase PcrA